MLQMIIVSTTTNKAKYITKLCTGSSQPTIYCVFVSLLCVSWQQAQSYLPANMAALPMLYVLSTKLPANVSDSIIFDIYLG